MSITLQQLDKATCQPIGEIYYCHSMDEARTKALQLRIYNYAIKHIIPPVKLMRSPSCSDIKKLVEESSHV